MHHKYSAVIDRYLIEMKFAANLTMMFPEIPHLLLRYEAAASAGFKFVECADPYQVSAEQLSAKTRELRLEQVLINSPTGKFSGGERGIACMPSRKQEFVDSIDLAINYAKALNCKRQDMSTDGTKLEEEAYLFNLRSAADKCQQAGITLLIEPINCYSIPNYFLSDFTKAVDYLHRLQHPNVKLQLDIFHLQQISGNLSRQIKDLLPFTDHIQIAQVPHRHEPNVPGEVDYRYILDLLQKENYEKFIGLEYIPKGSTVGGLCWLSEFGYTL